MNILVTGGSGTIGGYVLRELLRMGHAASSYSRTAPKVEGVRFIPGDIMDQGCLTEAGWGHDAIIHLAAVPGPGRATPDQLIGLNVVGTVMLLEAAVQASVGKVIFASSGAATGFAFQQHEIVPQYLPLDEEHPSAPQDEYGLSKLLAEMTCKRYSDAFSIQTICLRIHNNWYLDRAGAETAVRGGWAKGMTVEDLWEQRYVKTIEDRGEWPVPGPPPPKKMLWMVTDARDAAQAFRLAVENEKITHEVFLVSGHDTCSLVDTPTLIAQHFPDVPLKRPLEDYASLWSHEKVTRMLGYRPQYTWRESDFSEWLEQSGQKLS